MNSTSMPLVSCEGVSKKFCRDLKKSLWYGVKDSCADLFNRKPLSLRGSQNGPSSARAPTASAGEVERTLRPGEFWANRDISFRLDRGECLGLIGRNGAGKTTILKMLTGLIKPDAGRIEMRGRIGALIALGAGFNPILTGRENVRINASILGLTRREIAAKMDEIIEFSEISPFIDAPVRSYSSGMQVRLGFAVATALEPDVLIIDEVLAVGDLAFRVKCMTKIGEMMSSAAVIFVSHQTELITHLCHRTMVLDGGRVQFLGPTQQAVDAYAAEQPLADRWTRTVEGISHVTIEPEVAEIQYGMPLDVVLSFVSHREFDDCIVRICIVDRSQKSVAEWRSNVHGQQYSVERGNNVYHLRIDSMLLSRGTYSLNLNLQPPLSSTYLISASSIATIKMIGDVASPCAALL